MRYGYLRDPVFVSAFLLYWLNRLAIKPFTDVGFVHNHFNDFLCIPLFVPVVVFVARSCALRTHDRPPEVLEIFLPLLVWSIMFELVLPASPFWSQWAVGDPIDILWYSIGAFVASLCWTRQLKQATEPSGEREAADRVENEVNVDWRRPGQRCRSASENTT